VSLVNRARRRRLVLVSGGSCSVSMPSDMMLSLLLGLCAVAFKNKLNFKGPCGGGFRCQQHATAYVAGRIWGWSISS
jgi:hypothetical protein